MTWSLRIVVLAGILLAASFLVAKENHGVAQQPKLWVAGTFSFSDELGGFKILGIDGSGAMDDPIIIHQEMQTSGGSTMIVRHLNPLQLKAANHTVEDNAVYVRFVTANNSNVPWVGYGLELQEIKDKPSTYGDGLSFDQISRETSFVRSDKFLEFERQYEPGDRVVFRKGVVNHQEKVKIEFVVTDFTPTAHFYIYQDPLIPAS